MVLAIVELLLECMHGKEGIGWLSGWAQYVPLFFHFFRLSQISLEGAYVYCAAEMNISFLTSVSGTECQGGQRA